MKTKNKTIIYYNLAKKFKIMLYNITQYTNKYKNKEDILMVNWQVIGQLLSLAIIVLVGPAIIVLLSFKRGNL
uniref:Photosystem II reaction center protein Psb30 n=1 Tax=Batrachospermum sp. TaxID=31373 RepID=A0A8K1YUV5_9FLOR|nr:photosystem II protein psb30 [Batrachospermum sp.]